MNDSRFDQITITPADGSIPMETFSRLLLVIAAEWPDAKVSNTHNGWQITLSNAADTQSSPMRGLSPACPDMAYRPHQSE